MQDVLVILGKTGDSFIALKSSLSYLPISFSRLASHQIVSGWDTGPMDKGRLMLQERVDGFADYLFSIPSGALSNLHELRLFFGCQLNFHNHPFAFLFSA